MRFPQGVQEEGVPSTMHKPNPVGCQYESIVEAYDRGELWPCSQKKKQVFPYVSLIDLSSYKRTREEKNWKAAS